MSADEDFLARWSRRKVAAADKAAEPAAPADEQSPAKVAAPESEKTADEKQPPAEEFDLASLPPIDSITGISDIRDFLRAGVPAELTRAALRRAWSADPAIRDFVGLAENAWDFTDPTAMPGFGPLEATDDVQKMLAQIMSRATETTELPHTPPAADVQRAAELQRRSESGGEGTVAGAGEAEDKAGPAELPRAPVPADDPAHSDRVGGFDVAAQHEESQPEAEKPAARRTHGRALPH